jgi:hypothetical protein
MAALCAILFLMDPESLLAQASTVTCSSQERGDRQHCAADTSAGVALQRSFGASECLLGKTWGYDDMGVWVADGCSAEFIVGASGQTEPPQSTVQPAAKKRSPEYVPNLGFLLYEGEKGQIYMRLFSYARFLNQKSLKSTYTDFFGNTFSLQRREDIQLNNFFLQFE